jgi:hypothetical protein
VETSKNYHVKLSNVPSQDSIIKIKALKPKLFDYLPTNVNSILYMDVDIVVARDLTEFLSDMADAAYLEASKKKKRAAIAATGGRNASIQFDYGAFPDAKSHYVGFCAGCEKWHTGVMWFTRPKKSVVVTEGSSGDSEKNSASTSSGCMAAWERILLSGKYDTDQQSLDDAEKEGSCKYALTLPPRHLLFAKDYIGMALTGGHTFLHMTAAGRIQTQDYFYREMVLPRLRNAFYPTLNPGILKMKKSCAAAQKSPSESNSEGPDSSRSTKSEDKKQSEPESKDAEEKPKEKK